MSKIQYDELWTLIKKVKRENTLESLNIIPNLSCTKSVDRVISVPHNMEIDFKYYLKDELERKTNTYYFDEDLNKSYNFTNNCLNTASNMFLYYNMCPKFIYEWSRFFVDLMNNSPPDVIVQTLNRIMVTAKMKNDKNVRNIVKNLFWKIGEKFDENLNAGRSKSFNDMNSGKRLIS